MSLVITDPSVYQGFSSDSDFVVTLFRKTVAELPTDLERGTPILLRGLKVSRSDAKPHRWC
jgi:hypothetical protein